MTGPASLAARYQVFRRKLIQLLATSQWATESGITPEQMAATARGLGIDVEHLKAARQLVERERRQRGLKPVEGRKKNERSFPQLELDMPEAIWKLWQDWCEMQHATSNALLRGIIHVYLLGTWEPAYVGGHWRYKGQTYLVPRRGYEEKEKAAWPFRERPLLTRGAKAAIVFRARRLNTTSTALVRGLMLEILEGRYKSVVPRDARAMFHDVERYTRHLNLTGE